MTLTSFSSGWGCTTDLRKQGAGDHSELTLLLNQGGRMQTFAHADAHAVTSSLFIISGGQTGADRAALDWAIMHGVPHEGWCPKGRLALDGPLHAKYCLKETPSAAYPQRTEWNVRDSDATVVFTLVPVPTGGSKKTCTLAEKHGKPCLHLHPGLQGVELKLVSFVRSTGAKRLNVAGSRAEKEPGVYDWVITVLDGALAQVLGAK